MGSPYLSNNETILLSTHNIVVNTIPAEAILTSHRLMLIDYSHPQILPQDIPFAAIETVTIGDNSAKDPVLSLSIAAPDGTRNTIGMVFSQPQRTRRSSERDAWAAKLKEMSMTAQQEHGIRPAELVPPWVPGEMPVPEGKEKEKSGQSENVYRPLISAQKRGRNNGAPKKTRMVAAGAAIIIIIVAVVLGSYFLAPSLWGKVASVPSALTPTPAPTTAQTTVPTPTPEPVETPVPTTVATPVPTTAEPVTITPTAAPQLSIPMTGVWVHVKYDGKYTGTAGTSGGLRDIAGSDEGYTQIPITQGILVATIQKLDNSGNLLTVEFYKDGTLLKKGTTRAPKGTVDIQAELPAIPW
ncbi:hypothetical protein [Methanoregula sp.]|uniref:hypothetical protein n=1 Tax=Methanoregula sp. TaxID=2052170 RepID=UPI0035663211